MKHRAAAFALSLLLCLGLQEASAEQEASLSGVPWTPSRFKEANITASAGAIESGGAPPSCEATVWLGRPWNETDTYFNTITLLIQDWGNASVPHPWSITVINPAYVAVTKAWNLKTTLFTHGTITGVVEQQWAALQPEGGNTVPIGFIAEVPSSEFDFLPSSVFLNGGKCVLVVVGGFTGSNSASETESSSVTPVRIQGNQIIGVQGIPIQMKGINWYGFEDGLTFLEGLWFGSTGLQMDMATITRRLRLLGYNALRLPFSMHDLFEHAPKDAQRSCQEATPAQVLTSTASPAVQGVTNGVSAEGACTDFTPPGPYSCTQQQGWGKCSAIWMLQGGYCQKTCGRCPNLGALRTAQAVASCVDVPPPGQWTCAQQQGFGKCFVDWMLQGNWCAATCGRCGSTNRVSGSTHTKKPSSGGSSSTPSTAAVGNIKQGMVVNTQLPAPPSHTRGQCNDYLPKDSVFNRYIYTMRFFASQGFYMIIDNHVNLDNTVYTNRAGWIQGWQRIAKAIHADEYLRKFVFYDILNEPDFIPGMGWQAQNGNPGMGDLYLQAMDTIHAVNADAVFVIEGLGQQAEGNTCWGDGVCTDEAVIQRRGISDPNPFFRTLLTKPYRTHVIVGVHIYPPSISGATTAYSGQALYQRLSLSFGYLNKRGYCSGGDCQLFPVMFGEWGMELTNDLDHQMMTDLVKYMNNVGDAVDGQHNPITSWFWWAWAPGGPGIIQADWQTVLWNKLTYMTGAGLAPWYSGRSSSPKTSPSSGQIESAQLPRAPYVLKAMPSPAGPAGSYCAAAVSVGAPFGVAPSPAQAALTITLAASGNSKIVQPYALAVSSSTYGGISHPWNWDGHLNGTAGITGTVSGSWATLQPFKYNYAQVGFVVASAGKVVSLPTGIAINGVACTMSQRY